MPDIDDIAGLIPHQGAMCLHRRVLKWDAQRIVLATDAHRSLENPLRHRDRLHAVHLCEYGAQAMAVHGGLRARAAGSNARPGMLVSLRGVSFHVQRIDDLPGELIVEAVCLLDAADSQQYEFSVRHDSRLLATGRAAVMLR